MKPCKTPRAAAPLKERLTLKSEGLTEVGSTRRYFPSVDRSSLFLALEKNSLETLLYNTQEHEQGYKRKLTDEKKFIFSLVNSYSRLINF
jgi:hypothetical protein